MNKQIKYRNPAAFFSDLSQSEQISNKVITLPQRAECYALYLNARKDDGTVLGGGKLLGNNDFVWKDDVIANFGTVPGANDQLIANTQRQGWFEQNFQSIKPIDTAPGAVLAGKNWSILGNDAYILGSVHAAVEAFDQGKEPEDFHVCLPSEFLANPMPFLWSDKSNLPRVTGREFLGLLHFGYQFVITQIASTEIMQFQLMPEKRNQASAAGLIEYARLMKKITDKGTFEAIIRAMIAQAQAQAQARKWYANY